MYALDEVMDMKKVSGELNRLRKIYVKIERYKSHFKFVQWCRRWGVVPRSFRLKWTVCMDSNEAEQQHFNGVLRDTSIKHVSREIVKYSNSTPLFCTT